MKKNYLISTGGSGGHVVPATILYKHLSNKANVIISSDKRGLRYLDQNNYQVEIIDTPKLNNFFILPINLVWVLFLTIKSILILKKKQIEKIFSTGGYMSLPLFFAAKFLKKDIYLIEPNQILGRANKFFLNSCKKIFCYNKNLKNFPQKFRNKVVNMYPLVKEEIYNLDLRKKNKEKFTLLIVGGSQGANIFDNNLKNSILEVSKKFPIKVIHQTSEKNISFLENFYTENKIENKIFCFDKNFGKIMQQSDLCITRGGASTLAELSVLNIPFIVVPLPSSKDNHQFENASFYRDNGCCWIIAQDVFEKNIDKFLMDIMENKTNYFDKIDNLKKLNFQNTWINVNQKILENINEN